MNLSLSLIHMNSNIGRHNLHHQQFHVHLNLFILFICNPSTCNNHIVYIGSNIHQIISFLFRTHSIQACNHHLLQAFLLALTSGVFNHT